MNAQRKTRKRHKATPLRPLTLRSAPLAKRALVWSPDAELAVAADDSVYVFVPQFGDEDEESVEGEDEEDEEDGGEGEDEDEDDIPMGDGGDGYDALASTETETRSQFAAGSLHIPVSHPPLDVRVNQRLYAAAGLPFPFGGSGRGDEGETGSRGPEEREAEPARTRAKAKGRGKAAVAAGPALRDSSHYRRPGGAGAGPLTAVAGTMNSVVALAWSPAGVGRNRRAVLAVLTSAGVVAVYGEGEGFGAGREVDEDEGKHDSNSSSSSSSSSRRPTRHYDTSRWQVLWAVGERLVVPPQTQMGECVVSVAWSGALQGGRGGALLLYRTDQDEVVVLRVGRTAGPGALVWQVSEEARFVAAGPHAGMAETTSLDAHFVPGGTAFGLRCSPWLVVDDAATTATTATTQVCLVGYLACNYVGFRRLTVTTDTHPDRVAVRVDVDDVDGLCLFLGTDAFLEWEDGIWSVDDSSGGSRVCRGVVATPLVARPFEVVLLAASAAAARGPPPAHDLLACGTAYPSADEARTNPIQDLIIHPPAAHVGPPAYTLVRLSATATNDDWYETGGGPPAIPSDPPAAWPQWTLDVARKIKVSATPGVGDDDGDDDDDDPAADSIGHSMLDPALHPLRLAPASGPEMYLHRARLWGLALAPGGVAGAAARARAVTAVLVTDHAALQVDRGGWYRDRSRVLFGWPDDAPADSAAGENTHHVTNYHRPPVSTEARMWSNMYGRGPPVLPTVRTRPQALLPVGSSALAQTCTICSAPIDVDATNYSASPNTHDTDQVATCARGHVFDRCGATGLAIQRPGASRVCGVCASRTLRADAVADMFDCLGTAAVAVEALRKAVAGDVCGRCGGKFHD